MWVSLLAVLLANGFAFADGEVGYITFWTQISTLMGYNVDQVWVRVLSENAFKLCEGIFNRKDLENFSCPYDRLEYGDNVFFITV